MTLIEIMRKLETAPPGRLRLFVDKKENVPLLDCVASAEYNANVRTEFVAAAIELCSMLGSTYKYEDIEVNETVKKDDRVYYKGTYRDNKITQIGEKE